MPACVSGCCCVRYAAEVQEMWKYQPSEYEAARILERKEAAKLRAKVLFALWTVMGGGRIHGLPARPSGRLLARSYE